MLPTQNPGDRGLSHPPRAALAAAVHAITVLTNARLHGDLAGYAPSAELIVLPAANPGHIPPTDFGHASQLITRALAAASRIVSYGNGQSVIGRTIPIRCPASRSRPIA